MTESGGLREAARPDPGLRVCNRGICGTRGGRASGTGAVREFRGNRAGRRAGAAPGSGIAGSHLQDLRDTRRAGFRDGAVREFRDNRAGPRAAFTAVLEERIETASAELAGD